MRSTWTQPCAHPVVLVVEDSPSPLQTILEILEGANFVVLAACNATEAFALAKCCASPINLLITKLHPAEMPGPCLAYRLRNLFPEMGVLYSSANPLATLEIPDADEVVSCMLPRPFNREILLSRVNTLLAPHTPHP